MLVVKKSHFNVWYWYGSSSFCCHIMILLSLLEKINRKRLFVFSDHNDFKSTENKWENWNYLFNVLYRGSLHKFLIHLFIPVQRSSSRIYSSSRTKSPPTTARFVFVQPIDGHCFQIAFNIPHSCIVKVKIVEFTQRPKRFDQTVLECSFDRTTAWMVHFNFIVVKSQVNAYVLELPVRICWRCRWNWIIVICEAQIPQQTIFLQLLHVF